MSDTSIDRPMTPREASAYCASIGYPLAEATLAKLRCVGGGPTFSRFGRRIGYRASVLNEWLERRTTTITNSGAPRG
jgi:hypothetical protein